MSQRLEVIWERYVFTKRLRAPSKLREGPLGRFGAAAADDEGSEPTPEPAP